MSSHIRTTFRRCTCVFMLAASLAAVADGTVWGHDFQAGACAVDISPTEFPVLVNGGFFAREAKRVVDPLHARWLVFKDQQVQLAICVVDTCVIPRELADQVKAAVAERTGIRVDRILISATHTHSAPSLMQAHGTDRDPNYPSFLLPRMVEGAVRAQEDLKPAKAGWTTIQADQHTYCRRWIRRPDRLLDDPFGRLTVCANMHPGHCNPDVIGPAGPADPGLTILAVESLEGHPLALLANYSMHYFGCEAVSSDYYGRFATKIAHLLSKSNAEQDVPPVVGIMSQGTSGDSQWMDYSRPRASANYDLYADELAKLVHAEYAGIEFRNDVALGMIDRDLELDMRLPSEERLHWADTTMKEFGGFEGGAPKTRPQIYAREQFFIQKYPQRNVKLQAIRIGDLSMAAISAEVFAITGLKLKLQSPLTTHMNFSLANGEDGYIPPPEQHTLGGYTTWEARTAGLEITAEPKIVAELLDMLEEVTGKQRRGIPASRGPYVDAVLDAAPVAYWNMNEIDGPCAADASGHDHSAEFVGGHAVFLPGPASVAFSTTNQNRCVHFAGGHLDARVPAMEAEFSTELWFWNGLPNTARDVTGTLVVLGDAESAPRLILTGRNDEVPGRLAWAERLTKGETTAETLVGGVSPIRPCAWNHLVLARDGDCVRVYLNGDSQPEIDAEIQVIDRRPLSRIGFGGAAGIEASFEGRLDEIAVYPRALGKHEMQRHFELSEMKPPEPMPIPQPPSTWMEKPRDPNYQQIIRRAKPVAYWPLYELNDQRRTVDASGNGHDAQLEEGSGPLTESSTAPFHGGRLHAVLDQIGDTWSVEFWFRNSLSNTDRPVTAYLVSRGPAGAEGAPGDHVGVGGTHTAAGRLFFFNGNRLNQILLGVTEIPPGTWNHVVLVREGRLARLYLNGHHEPEFSGEIDAAPESNSTDLFIGGRNDNFANLQGAVEDISIYDRGMTPEEAAAHFAAMHVE